jgi:hypothetical protein
LASGFGKGAQHYFAYARQGYLHGRRGFASQATGRQQVMAADEITHFFRQFFQRNHSRSGQKSKECYFLVL